MTVKFITDAQSRILAVEHGEADLALYPPTTAAKTLTGRTDAYFDTGTPHGPTFQLFLNEHTAPFNDVAVRRAVQAGINYDQLASQVMNGLYKPATGMYASTAPYALTTQVTNASKAEDLLAKDGWTAGSSGGVRHKDGKALAFTIDTYAQQPDTQTLAVAIQAELSQIGFDVSISGVPDIDAAQKNPTGWTSALEGDGTTSFAGDPITPLQEFFASKGPSNTTGVDNPKLDSLIDQLASTLDASTRRQPAQADSADHRQQRLRHLRRATAPGCHRRPGVASLSGAAGEPVGQRHDRTEQLTGRRRGAQVKCVPHWPGSPHAVGHQHLRLGSAAARPG